MTKRDSDAATTATGAIPATLPPDHHHPHRGGHEDDRRPSPDAAKPTSNRGGVQAGFTSTAASAAEKSERAAASSPSGQTQHASANVRPPEADAEGIAAPPAGSAGRSDGAVEGQRQRVDVGEAMHVTKNGGRVSSPPRLQTPTQMPQAAMKTIVTAAQGSSSPVEPTHPTGVEQSTAIRKQQQQPPPPPDAGKGGEDAAAKPEGQGDRGAQHGEGRQRGTGDPASADLAAGKGVSTPSPAPPPPQLPAVAVPAPSVANGSIAPIMSVTAEKTRGRKQGIEPRASPRQKQRLDGVVGASATPSPVVVGSGGGDGRRDRVQSGLVRIAPAPRPPAFDFAAAVSGAAAAAARVVMGGARAEPSVSGAATVPEVSIDVSAWPDPAKVRWRR